MASGPIEESLQEPNKVCVITHADLQGDWGEDRKLDMCGSINKERESLKEKVRKEEKHLLKSEKFFNM